MGYNPVEIWLNETDEFGNPLNQWYGLGYEYGYEDIFYTQTSTETHTAEKQLLKIGVG